MQRLNPFGKKKKKKPVPAKRGKAKPRKRNNKERSWIEKVLFACLIGLAVVALALFLVLRTGDRVSVAENIVGTLLSPVSGMFSGVTAFVRDTVNGKRDYDYISDELERTRRQLMETQLQLTEHEQAMQENDRLRQQLDAKLAYGQYEPLHARVINRNPGVWFDSFSINVGTNQGVKVNHAVVVGGDLVGRVFEVGTNYAKVMSIINEESAVGCLVERSREDCMMYGRISQDTEIIECEVGRLRQIGAIMPGDILVTSGTDKVYPKGLRVAAITQVSRQQSATSDRFVYAQPLVDFLRIEDVLVLRVEAERDDVGTAPLPVETPKPQPLASAAPVVTPAPTAGLGTMEADFHYPDGTFDEEGTFIESPTQPNSLLDGTGENNMLMEDEWAR